MNCRSRPSRMQFDSDVTRMGRISPRRQSAETTEQSREREYGPRSRRFAGRGASRAQAAKSPPDSPEWDHPSSFDCCRARLQGHLGPMIRSLTESCARTQSATIVLHGGFLGRRSWRTTRPDKRGAFATDGDNRWRLGLDSRFTCP
jgi:hypothetical protein